MKKQVLLAAFVVGLSSTALHANQTVTTSNGSGCSNNQSTGQKLSLGTEFDTFTEQGTVFLKMEWELGRHKIPAMDCNRLYNIEVSKQQLELQKLQMEIELMKAKIEAAKVSGNNPSTGDDW
jgi:hypothetical protein